MENEFIILKGLHIKFSLVTSGCFEVGGRARQNTFVAEEDNKRLVKLRMPSIVFDACKSGDLIIEDVTEDGKKILYKVQHKIYIELPTFEIVSAPHDGLVHRKKEIVKAARFHVSIHAHEIPCVKVALSFDATSARPVIVKMEFSPGY